MVEILIPDIEKALSKNEDLEEYHFKINDEQNVMRKIEKLFKGESDEFVNSEENTIKEIIQFFPDDIFPIEMSSNELPEKITIQMDPEILIFILKESPRKFLISTNQKSYKCNSLGIISSKTILAHLQSHPTST